MFASILCLAIILVVSYKMDYQMLVTDGSKKERFVYGTMYTIGFIVTAIYVCSPTLPDPLHFLAGPINPLNAWLVP
ncbi:hypothetical protein [Alicyclobacillus fastidiosus]|uniref:Uncharacterized protein n=1 Tax=Alicyclobacillus fastidiosus TaxID=392011 RepID=A0ABV5AC54_9BACL|nr:hypothetical protein [Alicyclobacillus fastidiosus]WEH11444.1 hypothetical protein PYS47_09635 [Alicyclobacillus fastidiosus]